MTPYLKSLAQKFVQQDELRGELYRYRFFFQNKRAGKFFIHYIKELLPEDALQILPEVTTLPSFLRERLHIVEEDVNHQLFLIFHLHNIYNEWYLEKGQHEEVHLKDLNSFYQFGQQILIDFNDLDLQLADHRIVFGNFQDLKDLEVDPKEYLSDSQLNALKQFVKTKDSEKVFEKRFTTFYQDLAQIYERYKHRLREENLAYNGMMLRDTIDKIKSGELDLFIDGKINVFVALNALTKAEQELLKMFKTSGTSYFYWDYDSPLFNNEKLAGSFKKDNQSAFPEPAENHPLYFDREVIGGFPEIEVIAIPSKIGQATYIGNELNNLASTSEGRRQLREMKVAVVLANERLLTPLLSNLDASCFEDEGIGNLANVTMGYPIRELPLVGILIRLLQLQKIKRKRDDKYWRGDEICEVLSNNIFGFQDAIQKEIIDNTLLFIKDHKLSELIQSHGKNKDERDLLNALFYVDRKSVV